MRNQPSVRIAFDLPISVDAYNALKYCYGEDYINQELIELMVEGLKHQVGNIDQWIIKIAEETNIAAEEMMENV